MAFRLQSSIALHSVVYRCKHNNDGYRENNCKCWYWKRNLSYR